MFPLKKAGVFISLVMVMVLFSFQGAWASYDSVLQRWSKIQKFEDPMGGFLDVQVTWFSEEYLRALAESEADKNLWTQDEKENYLYNLLKTLQIDEYIPVEIAFDNRGESMHMAPFDNFVTLWIDNDSYSPTDYDKRFNFSLQGKLNGYVFFPRYDEKGNNLLEGAKRVRVQLAGGISSIAKGDISFFWDIYKDNPEKLFSGKAMRQFEIDRLLKRTKKLNSRKVELEDELKGIYEELLEVQKRMDELQNQTE
ncbi:MAG TPA: hypothetical protein PLA80_01975 [Synergistaceae bacterium]|nr:hypothetical protein [Synergistaceae bacterium]